MKKQFRGQLITVCVILLALIFMVSIFMRFRKRMDTELNDSVTNYLSGNVDALATAFQTKLEDQLIMLESQSRYFSDVDLTDYNAMKRTIMSTRGMEAFTSIGVASGAGSTMNYQGKSSGNILLKDYFKQAMAGKNAISAEPSIDEFGNEVLVLAVPIRQQDDVTGVIYGTFTRDALSDLLRNVSFGEESASVLITGNGTILARTADSDLIDADSKNLQEVIPGLDIKEAEKTSIFRYQGKDGENILALRPIGFHDWYFGTIVPRDMVTRQSDRISRYVVLVMLEIALMVTVLLLYIFFVWRHNENVHRRLQKKAKTDPLTGLLNKTAFAEAVEQVLHVRGELETGALFIIDLDDFKQINDTLGHAVGDRVLVESAKKLKALFRDSDFAGRIGGDEFAAFIHYPGKYAGDLPSLMKEKAEVLLTTLSKEYENDGNRLKTSISVGIAAFPAHGKDYKSLYENADKALYNAKRGGKNRYEVYV